MRAIAQNTSSGSRPHDCLRLFKRLPFGGVALLMGFLDRPRNPHTLCHLWSSFANGCRDGFSYQGGIVDGGGLGGGGVAG
ncbi:MULTISPECIES: hypothetical protein [unclassified Bradyrhizobium]|uniref:hypothetical protein n=1 Tax=unclassified Bradyrhizobium TaxID=2631580 RepID=UPI001FF92AF4|nr:MULTISPECIES: hypothetical protein [unclassified Bradyrhizobium]MCK1419668.1 hypothetical protein [Bradyrhizobium sp. CW12]MCK1648937.1 hypothetical protein [Bradyrhizobium sp. 154]